MAEEGGAAAGILEIRREVTVAIPRARAWKTFVGEIASWWPPAIKALPGSRLVLEPWAGGRYYEDGGGGKELLWYHVLAVLPGSRILLGGDITAEFGGPARTHLALTFEDAGEGTLVRLHDRVFAGGDRGMRDAMDSGWGVVLDAFAARCAAPPRGRAGKGTTGAGTSRGSGKRKPGRPGRGRSRKG